MSDIKNIMRVFRSVAGVIAVLAVVILGLAGLSYGFQWLWAQFSLGFSGLGLGSIIVGITYYATFINSNSSEYLDSLNKDFGFNLNLFGQIGIISSIGFFYGLAIICGAVVWFLTPETIINSLPSFSALLAFSFGAGILLVAAVGFAKLAIKSFPNNIGGSFFMLGLLAAVLLLLNYPIWGVFNNFPSNYYLIGIAFFIFILFIQILILTFGGIFPELQNKRQQALEDKNQTKQRNNK